MVGADVFRSGGIALLVACGCAGRPAATPTRAGAATAAGTVARPVGVREGARPTSAEPPLVVKLTARIEPAAVLVELKLRGGADELRRLALTRALPDEVRDLDAVDASGRVPLSVAPSRGGLSITLSRAPVPPLTVRYTRLARPFAVDDSATVALDPDHFTAPGDALFALPAAWEGRKLGTRVDIDATPFRPEARGAWSLGVENRRSVELTPAALRRASFIGGTMGQAVLDGPEGHDEVAWLGYTSFDPRSVAAEVATFRSAAREYFGERRQAPFTLLIVSDSRSNGGFDVAREPASVMLRVGVGQAYTAPLRVSVAHQLLREWMGATLHVGPSSDRDGAESIWFVDGVTRYLARELSFRFGLLTPAEYLTEVEEIERITRASALSKSSNAELGARAADPAAALLLVARGARHATSVDAALRAKSKGKFSLDGVLRELYRKAVLAGAPLSTSAWVEALRTDLGADADALFAEEIQRGTPRALPADGLGPCFAPVPRSFDSFALGFAVDGDLGKPPARVTQVEPRGPAAAAGLRSGDRIVRASYEREQPASPVRLELERPAGLTRLEFLPRGPGVPGKGWKRLPAPADDRCARR